MRNLLALIGLLVVVGGGVGWYMGWYKFTFVRSADGNLQIQTNVDTNKVSTDVSNGFKSVSAAVENEKNKLSNDAGAAPPAGAPGATPGPVAPPQGSAINPLAPANVVPAGGAPDAPATSPGGAVPLLPPK